MVSLLGLFGVFVALVSPATAQLENGKRVTNLHSHLFVAAQATLLANILNTVKNTVLSGVEACN